MHFRKMPSAAQTVSRTSNTDEIDPLRHDREDLFVLLGSSAPALAFQGFMPDVDDQAPRRIGSLPHEVPPFRATQSPSFLTCRLQRQNNTMNM